MKVVVTTARRLYTPAAAESFKALGFVFEPAKASDSPQFGKHEGMLKIVANGEAYGATYPITHLPISTLEELFALGKLLDRELGVNVVTGDEPEITINDD
jgi:hypothetical protein